MEAIADATAAHASVVLARSFQSFLDCVFGFCSSPFGILSSSSLPFQIRADVCRRARKMSTSGWQKQYALLSPRRWLFASICPHSGVEFLAFSSRDCYSRRIVLIFCRCGDPLHFSLVLCSPRRAEVPSVSLWIHFCFPLCCLRLTAAAAVD